MSPKDYKDELIDKRIKRLEELARIKIKEELEYKMRFKNKKPTKAQVEKEYEKRIKEYEEDLNKTNKGFATSGPAAL